MPCPIISSKLLFSGTDTARRVLTVIKKTPTQLLKVRYDVNRTAEVYLRVAAVTFLNKLMKRVQKIKNY